MKFCSLVCRKRLRMNVLQTSKMDQQNLDIFAGFYVLSFYDKLSNKMFAQIEINITILFDPMVDANVVSFQNFYHNIDKAKRETH